VSGSAHLRKKRERRDPILGPLSPPEQRRAVALGIGLRDWYAHSGRSFPWREWSDPYRLTVVELLLQRTRSETVKSFAPGFFKRFPNWRSLAMTQQAELELALAPIGLQARRAASLSALAKAVVDDDLDPASGDAPGIGQYIRRAIAVARLGEPVAMVDSNWVRVLCRYFGGGWMSDYRYDVRLQTLAQATVEAGGDARAVNWAVLDLGATICIPRRPRCGTCPVSGKCEYFSAVGTHDAGSSLASAAASNALHKG
jgi:A/G-specific adenine glycosylase